MPESTMTAAREPSPETVALDEYAQQIELLRLVERQLSRFTEARKRLQGEIKTAMGAAEVGTVDGQPAVTWKSTLRVAVSQKLLKQLHPEVLPDVQDIAEVRTFKVLPR